MQVLKRLKDLHWLLSVCGVDRGADSSFDPNFDSLICECWCLDNI